MSAETFSIVDGVLESAEQIPSPNCNERPNVADISLLVIHNISLPPGQFGGGEIAQFFCNQLDCDAHPYFDQLRDMKVSAHLLIARDGGVIQFVNFNRRAWHAGESVFAGRPACNDYSIGIELEGVDDHPYARQQYQTLIGVTRGIQTAYPKITNDRITGHSDIAPGRKTDPGPAFDWSFYRDQLRS